MQTQSRQSPLVAVAVSMALVVGANMLTFEQVLPFLAGWVVITVREGEGESKR